MSSSVATALIWPLSINLLAVSWILFDALGLAMGTAILAVLLILRAKYRGSRRGESQSHVGPRLILLFLRFCDNNNLQGRHKSSPLLPVRL